MSLKEEILKILDEKLSIRISLHIVDKVCYDDTSVIDKEKAAVEIVKFLDSKDLYLLGYKNFSTMLDDLDALPACAGDCSSIGNRFERGCDDCDMIEEKKD